MRNRTYKILWVTIFTILIHSCGIPKIKMKAENTVVPESFGESTDTINAAELNYHDFFQDQCLVELIDSALKNNQELNITLQEIEIANADIRAKRGEIFPSVTLNAGGGIEKVGEHTSQGASDAITEIAPGKPTPQNLPDIGVGFQASWEIDIWKKLRNAKKASQSRYLATVEAKDFMVTKLVAEISNSYYELLALDNQFLIVKQNLEIQQNVLKIVKLQKQAARVTELAVKKFEAEVAKNKSHLFYIQQNIVETENRINFLVGRFPQQVYRNSDDFIMLDPDTVATGIPSQLLANRPDIQMAEFELAASKLDVKVAKAKFFPSFKISLGAGFNAFSFKFLFSAPASIVYNIIGDLMMPLINRAAIKAEYISANARQLQAVYRYEKSILNGYIEVANQMANIHNLKESYDYKSKQVEALTRSISISTILFKSARADYMEVLMTQRDALESKIELIEIKKEQMSAVVNMYRSLGGGWR